MMDHLQLYWIQKDCDLIMKKKRRTKVRGGAKRYGDAEEKNTDR